MLTTMTNEIVDWINNGTTPRFTQDFGSVLSNAGNAAVGDVLMQYSLTQPLCQPFAFDIQFQLQQPAPLVDQVRCSLSSVISNYSSFRNNFNDGGWVGYQELLKPQNNQWGVEIMTQNELINQTNQRTSAATLQQQVNVGFNSETCDSWQLTDERSNQPVKGDYTTETGDNYPDPNTQPPIPPDYATEQSYYWKCTKTKVTTPGATMAAGLAKATYGTFDEIVNSKDITNSLAIITDAAFNKLIQNGVKGLKDLTIKTFAPTSAQTSALGAASTEVQSYQNTQNQLTENIRNTYLGQLNSATNSILSASSSIAAASSTNESIISISQDIITCLSLNTSDPDYVSAENALSVATLSTRSTIQGKMAAINIANSNLQALIAKISDKTACGQTCLSNIDSNYIASVASTPASLDADATTILTGLQATLNDLSAKKTNDCHL